ncbi:MAG: hypothetical protein ACTS73_01485 [Arsenophonus sp. NEOnobi-MAG3]
MIYHEKSILQVSTKPDITYNLLHALISNDAKQLIISAVEAELKSILQQHAEKTQTLSTGVIQSLLTVISNSELI